jgi:hypothetical protein
VGRQEAYFISAGIEVGTQVNHVGMDQQFHDLEFTILRRIKQSMNVSATHTHTHTRKEEKERERGSEIE